MRNVKRVHHHIAQFKAAAGVENAAIEFGLKLEFDGFLGGSVAINGKVELGTEADEAVDVVRMFMGHQDAGKSFGTTADGGKALPDLAGAETGIDEDAGFIGFQIGAIAARTAPQNSQLNGHGWTVTGGCGGSNN